MGAGFRLRDGAAVVTGAAGGIGAALAGGLAARGGRLALVDRDAAGLEARAAGLRADGAEVSTHVLDVSDREACAALPEAVRAAHGSARLLINNAGVAAGGEFEALPEAMFDRVMEVNLHAPIRLTRAFLPMLREADEARVVNISSLFGLVAPPGQTAYAASKFGLRAFSEALRHELAREGASVGVTVAHPGGVETRISRDALIPEGPRRAEIERGRDAFEKNLKLAPERAAEIILRAVEARRGRVLVGGDAKLLGLIGRLFPETYWSKIARLLPAEEA